MTTYADMDARHQQHTSPDHPRPGICAACRQPWPCDARQLLDRLAPHKFGGVLVELAELIRNPPAWWYRANHTRCPVCGQEAGTGDVAAGHGHDLQEWRAARASRNPAAPAAS